MPKAIIFDLDDTIVAYDTVTASVWGDVCRRFAPAEGLDAEKLLETIMSAGNWYWGDPERHRQGRLKLPEARREVVRIAFNRLGLDSSELADTIADTYTVEREEAAFIIPEAIPTLERLKDQGIRLALITNGMSIIQRAKLKRFNLEPFFESIIVEGEFGAGKPDNSVFLHTLEKLNVKSSEAWMVGDDLERDIAPCLEMGIYAIWVDRRGTGLSVSGIVKPDAIVSSINEIFKIIQV